MSPALIRSALLTLVQSIALAACSTTSEDTKYHLVPPASPGALIAAAPASSAATGSPMQRASLRTSLSIDEPSHGATITRFGAGT